MRWAHVTVALALVPALGGCGDDRAGSPAPAAGERTGAYIAAARTALGTPAKVASLLSQGLAPGATPPSAASARALEAELARDVAHLRRVPISDRRLDAQRDRLADGLAALRPALLRVARDLEAGDRTALRASGNAFLDKVRALPSRIDTASS